MSYHSQSFNFSQWPGSLLTPTLTATIPVGQEKMTSAETGKSVKGKEALGRETNNLGQYPISLFFQFVWRFSWLPSKTPSSSRDSQDLDRVQSVG